MAETVTLAGTTYNVTRHEFGTLLTGPRGATYSLVPEHVGSESGVHLLVSLFAGPKRDRFGRPVRVVEIGEVVEEYVPGRVRA